MILGEGEVTLADLADRLLARRLRLQVNFFGDRRAVPPLHLSLGSTRRRRRRCRNCRRYIGCRLLGSEDLRLRLVLPRLCGLSLELVFLGVVISADSFARGLDRDRFVLYGALDHHGHYQHDRSSERDWRTPAQPRARPCRATARDSSARLVQHATIELGRHVLAAELAVAL